MILKTCVKICLPVLLGISMAYANDCPKWFPMMNDDIIVVMSIYNPSITGADLDCDELVDTIDPDIDGDGIANASDAFPRNSAEYADSDGDGIGDNADKPIISMLSPKDGATNVAALASLSVTYGRFDTLIQKAVGKTFRVYKADGTEHSNFNVSASQVSINGHTVTVNPNSHLVYGAGHYIQIDTGAFIDTTGEQNPGINNSSRWNFSVLSGSGSCACDDFDNCDLPADLQ